MSRKTLENKIRTRLRHSSREVFLRKDFEDLGGYDQVGRVLRKLVKQEELIKVGYGLYCKARVSMFGGQVIPTLSVQPLLREIVSRLGATAVPSTADQQYNSGKSTQVPTGRVIGVKGKRIDRKLGYNGIPLGLEQIYDE